MRVSHNGPEPISGEPGHSLAWNSIFLFVGQFATASLSLILTAVMGRWLGVVDFGTYYLLMVWSTFVYVVVDWGQSAHLIRKAVDRHEDNGKLLGSALAFRAAAALLAALSTAMLVKVIGYDGKIASLASLAIVCGIPIALSQAYGYMFRGQNRMDLDVSVAVTGKFIIVAVSAPALILGGGLSAAVLLQAVGGLGSLIMAVILAQTIHLRAQQPELKLLRDLATGGTPMALFFVAIAVQPFIDSIVLAALVPPEVVGWYGAARNIMGLLCVPAMVLGAASFPKFVRVAASAQGLRSAIDETWRLLMALGALAAVGTFMFADVAVKVIYGKHFEPAAALLRVFAPIVPLLFINMLFGNAITAIGKTKEIALVKALCVVVGTGLAVLFIPFCQSRFDNGAIGLIVAFECTEVLMSIAFIWLLPRGVVDRSRVWDFLRAGAAAVIATVMFWPMASITPWVGVPMCIVIYMVAIVGLGLVRRGDLHELAPFKLRSNCAPLSTGGGASQRHSPPRAARRRPQVCRRFLGDRKIMD